jgi:hypothetical protein
MKFVEIQSGVLQPVSNEENIILEMVKGFHGPLPKSKLNQRERELARQLVGRGLLTRVIHEDKLCFVVNELEDIWEK